MLEFGGLGVRGRRVVRFDEGKGILDDDMSFHHNIDDAAERLKSSLKSSACCVKLPLCESLPQGPGSSHSSIPNDNEQQQEQQQRQPTTDNLNQPRTTTMTHDDHINNALNVTARRATLNAGHVDAKVSPLQQLQTKSEFSEPRCRLSRPLPGVTQNRSHDQHLADARFQRQLGQLVAQGRKGLVLVERLEALWMWGWRCEWRASLGVGVGVCEGMGV